jgi:hypothetical protein
VLWSDASSFTGTEDVDGVIGSLLVVGSIVASWVIFVEVLFWTGSATNSIPENSGSISGRTEDWGFGDGSGVNVDGNI